MLNKTPEWPRKKEKYWNQKLSSMNALGNDKPEKSSSYPKNNHIFKPPTNKFRLNQLYGIGIVCLKLGRLIKMP